jgi:hypothetical protein
MTAPLPPAPEPIDPAAAGTAPTSAPATPSDTPLAGDAATLDALPPAATVGEADPFTHPAPDAITAAPPAAVDVAGPPDVAGAADVVAGAASDVDGPLAAAAPADLGPVDASAPATVPAPGADANGGLAAAPIAAPIAAPVTAAPPPPTPRAKTKGVADIVFLVDVSGSMQPCLDALVRNIEVFVDSLSRGDANNAAPVKDWRGKVVGYRDFDSAPSEGLPWIEDHPFVRDAVALKAQLATLRAQGGGDEPESLLDALYTVATMEASPKGAQGRSPPGGATAARPRAWSWCSPTRPSRRRCRSRRPRAARCRTWRTW